MSAAGAEYGEWHSPQPPSTQPHRGDVATEDWVREVVTDQAFTMQSEFDKVANKIEKKLDEATTKMQKATDHQNAIMKDLLEKMGTLARALSEEQRRGVERDHDMESIMGLNLNSQRQPTSFTGTHATNQEIDKLKKEIAEIRGMRQITPRKEGTTNPADELDHSVKNLQHAIMEMEDQIKKCIIKLADNDKRFGKMEKKHTLSIISLSIFSLKALSFPRDQRERTEEALKREEEELRESLKNEGEPEVGGEEDEDDGPAGRHRPRNIYNDSDSEEATDALEVERNLINALTSCRQLMMQVDVAHRRREEQEILRLTEKLHIGMDKLDRAKHDAHKCGYREKDEEIQRTLLELMSYVES